VTPFDFKKLSIWKINVEAWVQFNSPIMIGGSSSFYWFGGQIWTGSQQQGTTRCEDAVTEWLPWKV